MLVAAMQVPIVRMLVQKPRVSLPADIRIPGRISRRMAVGMIDVMHMPRLMEVVVNGERYQSSG
jgi:hypothetical protein